MARCLAVMRRAIGAAISRGDVMAARDETKLVFPALAGLYENCAPYSYAIMRFAAGAILVPHGVTKILNTPVAKFVPNVAAKGLPLPEVLTYLTYFTESVAAACLAIGLFTRIAAAMIGIEMIVIVILFQWQFGYFWTNRGYEYALLWALLCIAIFFKGGGRYSVDRLIGREF
jgi:putative oxidoreductase